VLRLERRRFFAPRVADCLRALKTLLQHLHVDVCWRRVKHSTKYLDPRRRWIQIAEFVDARRVRDCRRFDDAE
jgi:hypothetical protein